MDVLERSSEGKVTMLRSKLGRTIFIVLFSAVVISLAAACGGRGDTDGGQGNDNAGLGPVFVSDGGSGGTLTITAPFTITTGSRVGFSVTAVDPTGAPLPFIRLFCESEHGIAIIEPSSGGVGFESTNADGFMSGVLGGLAPGSYILECRGPEGFNLIDRVSIVILGEVPEGFDGFPGAAGGNLGGGVIVENPTEDVTISAIQFTGVGYGLTANAFIDISRITDCDGDPATVDPEPFGPDSFSLTIVNNRDSRFVVNSVRFSIADGTGSFSLTESQGLIIPPNSTAAVVGTFIDSVFGGKSLAGSTIPIIRGDFNVTFTVTGQTGVGGSSISFTDSIAITIDDFDRCGS